MRRRPPSDAPLGPDDMDWDELFRLHAPRLRRRVARRVSDPAIVEDVVQETFIQAYRRWSTYDQSLPLWPWLSAIAVNLAWRWSQASVRATEAEREEPPEAALLDYFGAAGSDDHVANLDRRAAMRTALDGMTAKHRRILVRWELRDRSAADLAAAEGMTEEELRATVVRARRSLRRRYFAASGEGVFGWVGVGSLSGVLTRWRDRLARVASSGNWAEAAGSLAAAPVMAVGVAMITLVPAPSPDARLIGSVTEQPVAVVGDGPEGAAAASEATAAPASTTGRSTTASTASSPSAAASPDAAAPTLAAGPATARIARANGAQRTTLTLNDGNGSTTSNKNTTVHCEKGIVVGAVCQLQSLLPE